MYYIYHDGAAQLCHEGGLAPARPIIPGGNSPVYQVLFGAV